MKLLLDPLDFSELGDIVGKNQSANCGGCGYVFCGGCGDCGTAPTE